MGIFYSKIEKSLSKTSLQLIKLLVILAFSTTGIKAQVDVTATAGTLSASYSTLKASFDAINAGTHQGTISITISANTTETATAILNASGSGSSSYTSIGIRPTGSVTISGAITAGSSLIDLNGSDNVTINGLNNGTDALTISNTTAAATSGTSTIRLIGGATNNIITNCTVLGSFSGSVTTNGGNIFISTDAITSNGNDNNTISNCNITSAGSGLTTKGIYCNGSTTTTAINNSGNIFTGNNIYDFFGAAVSSTGIYIGGGNTDITISNNKFYQQLTRTQTTGAQHSAVWISNTSGNNFQVTGNTIGYSSSVGNGVYNFVGVSSSSVLIPIFLNVGTTTTSLVNSNTISSISMSGSVSGTSNSGAFRIIYVNSGLVTVNNNTIGSQSSNSNISFSSSSGSASDVIGIFNFGLSNFITNGNIIGGISATNTSTGAANVYGIRCNTGTSVTWTCENNIIGGSGTGSISSTSSSTSSIINGILNSNPIGTFTSNVIRNLSSNSGTVVGIQSTPSSNQNFSKNKIHNLSCSNSTGVVYGISITAGTTVNVYNNLIGKLYAPSTSATSDAVRGISLTSTTTLSNIKVYYNTIFLDATSTGTDFNTTALYQAGNSTASTANLDLQNNIIINKSTPRGSGSSVAFRRGLSSTANYAATSNRNIYYAGVPSSTNLIYNDGTNSDQTLTAFKARVASRDDNSQTEDVPFISLDGTLTTFLHVNNTTPTLAESKGISIATFNTDFDGDFRQGDASYTGTGTSPDIGADEFEGIPVPVCSGTPTAGTISGSTAVCSGLGTNLSLSGSTNALGITYQWAFSTTSGGPTTFLGTNSGQATGNLTNTTYYVVTVTCANSGLSATSPEFTVSVNPNPTVSVTPTSGAYCLPGGTAVSLTASGANTYSWLPSTGLSGTTGNSVNASPTSTTTYTVTGTDANGCIGSANSTINVGQFPVVSSITATPSSLCLGSSSQLSVLVERLNGPVKNYTFSNSTTTFTALSGASQLVASGSDDTPNGTPVNIGFDFYFGGSVYTKFSVSPDGWLLLGNTAATSEFSNAVTSITNIPKIYPYWDDMATGTNGGITYLTEGVTPNRILKVQWNVTIPRSTSSVANSLFQTWLYESDGRIEFRYGSLGTGSMSSSVGLTNSSTDFHSVTISSTTSSTITANNSNSGQPANGVMYTFTPATNPISSINWMPSTYLNNTTIINPTASGVTSSVNYTVSLTSSIGCSTNSTVAITAGSQLSTTASATSSTVCEGSNVTIQATPIGGGAPYSYAWTGPNGFTSNQQNPNISNIILNQGGTYSVTVTDNCGSTASAQLSIVVNPLPTVSVTPTSGRICLPTGTAVNLTASGALTYSWSPVSGLNSSTGSSVSANPSLTTIYTVSGTDANGCVSEATTSISVGTNPVVSSVTASPPAVCSGANSQLLASAVEIINGPVKNYSFTASSGAFNTLNGTTQLLGNAIDDTPSTTPTNIGFSFNYGGAIYNKFSVSPDGWILLGNGTASSQYSNLVTSTTNIPKIYAYWDDLATGTDGSVDYILEGISPNRILKIQWKVTIPRNTTGASNSLFQVWLYEFDSKIELRYGSLGSGAMSSSIGMTNTATDFQSVTISSSTTSTITPNDLNSGQPVNGTIYTFNPSIIPDYNWSPATYLSNTAINNPLANNVTSSLTYSVDIKSSTGCIITRTVAIAAGAPLTSAANSTPAGTICEGSALSLQATPTGGGAPFSYAWVGPNGFTSSLQNPQINNITTAASGNYSVTITDNCGANSLAQVSITVNAAPQVALNTTQGLICLPGGNAINLSASGAVSYSWSPANGLSSTTGNNVSANPTSTTIYTLTGTDGLGCTKEISATISVGNAPLISSTTALPNAVCSNGSSQLNVVANVPVDGTISNYSFLGSSGTYAPISGGIDVGNGAIGDDVGVGALPIGFNFNYNNTTYSTFAVSSNGFIRLGAATMSGLFTNNLTTNDNIIAALWDDNNTNGGNISYLLSGTSPNQVLTIQFTGMHVGSIGSTTTPTIDFQIKLFETSNKIEIIYGSTSASLTSTASIGISGAAGNYLSVTPLSPASSSTASSTTENSSIADASNIPSGTTFSFLPPSEPINSIVWTPSTFLNNTTIANPSATSITSSTVYTVTVSSLIGCTDTSTVSITAGQALTSSATASLSNILCEGSDVTLQATPIGGGGPYTFAWIGPNGFTSSAQDTLLEGVSINQAGTYTVNILDNCGATSQATVQLTVNSLPNVNISASASSICLPGGSAINLTASGANSYSWLPTNGLSDAFASTSSASPSSSTVYTVTGTDANGCIDTAIVSITVSNNPSISATASPDIVCINGSTQLLANASSLVGNYVFGTSTGTMMTMTGSTQVLASNNDDTPTASPVNIGFNFAFGGSSYSQCSVSPDGWILLGSGTATNQFTNNVTSANNLPKIYPYWDDLATGSNGNVSTLLTGTAPNRIFVINWFVTIPRNTSGAANSDFQLWLYEANGKIEFHYGNMNSASMSSSVGLTNSVSDFNSVTITGNSNSTTSGNDNNANQPASGTVYSFVPPSYSYVWSPASFMNDATIQNPIASAINTNTTFTVVATELATGCSSSQTVSVSTTPLSNINLTVSPSALVCEGTSVTINAYPVGGSSPFTYSWSPVNSNTDTLGFNATTTQTYTVIATDNCGTSFTKTITVNVSSTPTVSITSSSLTYCNPGNAIQLTASGADQFNWLPATGLNITNGANVNASPTTNTTYTVTGSTNGTGCSSTSTVSINVFATPVVTAISTPSTAICPGDTVALEANANIPITYTQATDTYFSENCGTTAGPVGDDVVSSALPIGFNFNYYGVNYTQFAISTNGNIQLGDGSGSQNNPTYSTAFTDVAIPNSNTPNNLIAIAWDDWLVSAGEINYGVIGNSPNRKLVVCFNTTGRGGGLADTLDGQIVLEETTNRVVINMFKKGVQPANTSTQGLENQTGSSTSTPVQGRQNQAWSVNKETRVFTPYSGTYTYLWSPSLNLSDATIINPTANGVSSTTTYSVIATEQSGCSSTGTVTINVNQAPVVNLGQDTATCGFNNIITLNAYQPNASYLWNNGSTDSVLLVNNNGTYYVTVTGANGCTGSDTINVSDNTPIVSLNLPFSSVCVDATANVLSGGLPSGGSYNGSGVSGANFDASIPGIGTTTIQYIYTDAVNGCSDTAFASVVVDPCIGIKDLSAINNWIEVYPNPTSGKFNLTASDDLITNAKIELISTDGKIIMSLNNKSNNSIEFDLESYPNAIYFVKIYSNNNVKVIKVVKQQ